MKRFEEIRSIFRVWFSTLIKGALKTIQRRFRYLILFAAIINKARTACKNTLFHIYYWVDCLIPRRVTFILYGERVAP